MKWFTAKEASSSMTEALSIYKEAAGGVIGEALLQKANMPTFARLYKRGRTYTGKKLSKLLETEIPGTENIRIMPKEKAQQLSHSLGHSPEALGIFALPGGGVATPLYLKANKKLQDVVAPPKGRRGQLLEKAARAPRDYRREYDQYHAKPERVRERLKRNQARRKLGLTKGDPREVDHKIPLKRGGSNARSNLRAVSLQENRKKFTKTANYREGGSFTHDGKRYNLNSALEVADSKQVVNIPVKSLDWVLKHDTPTPSRVAKADVTAPVLVAPDSMGRPTVIDGLHRLTKAKKQGLISLPARKLSRKDLSLVENRKKSTKTAAVDFNERSRKEQLGLSAAGLGAGLGAIIQQASPNLNVGTRLYDKIKNPEAHADVNLTEDQVQTLRKRMSPSTKVFTFDEMKSMASDPRNPNKKITDKQLDEYLESAGSFDSNANTVVAHRGKKGGSRRGHIVAHELGHAKLHSKPVIGKLMRAAPVIGSAGLSLGVPATVLAGTEEGTLENRIGNIAQYGGIAATAPRLLDEGYANIEGYRNLKRLGLSPEDLAKSRKGLTYAMGSYIANAAPTIATPFLLRKARRKYDERERKKTSTKTAGLINVLDKVAGNPRIPRKPGQPANSDKHSDLFTDENPKGTIHGLGFKTPAHAQKSVAKIKGSGKTHAHKTQAAIAMEQRARSMGKSQAAGVYRKFIEEQKIKTQKKKSSHEKTAKKLTTKGRNRIAEGNFALPGRRYPIHDASHARNALSRVSQHGTPSEKQKVRRKVAQKYPGIDMAKEAFDPRLTLYLLKKKKKATSPFMRRLYSSLADDSATLTDATIDAFNPTPKTRLGKVFKGVKSSAESVGQGTNPAMAATQAKLRFVADSGIGEGIQQAGESVAKGGKLMAESSTSLPKKILGRALQGSGKATQAAGFWTANAPDALPGVLPI